MPGRSHPPKPYTGFTLKCYHAGYRTGELIGWILAVAMNASDAIRDKFSKK